MVSTLVIASALPTTAATTPVEGTNRQGGTVTVSNDHAVLGDTLTVTGSGFTADPASGTLGQAVLAVKLNDSEYDGTFPWGFSGPSALDPSELTGSSGSDGFAAIGIEDDGTFEVQFTVPTDWDELGTNNFRFLGGSQTTGNKCLPLQTFSTQFAVLRPTQGFAKVTSTAHAQDSANTSKVAVSLRNFRAGDDGLGVPQKVAVKINGEGYESAMTCITTDGFGKATGSAPLAADLPLGTYTLNALAGTACGAGSDMPGRSLQASFEVTAASTVAPKPKPGKIGIKKKVVRKTNVVRVR